MSLFVKNLGFSTTNEGLSAVFAKSSGFKSATVTMKTAPDGRKLSCGYGFVEFKSHADALAALKKKQGALVDDRVVELQLSQRPSQKDSATAKAGGKKSLESFGKEKFSTRLCIRNLAFEANKKELRTLCGAHGHVVAVRMPRKSDGTGHRGFAFVEFLSRADAMTTFEALSGSHLYGRRLVLEPAGPEDSSVDGALKRARQREEREATGVKRRKLAMSHGAEGAFDELL